MSQRICSIPTCEEPHKARGYCSLHYWSWRRHGDPLTALSRYQLRIETPSYGAVHTRLERDRGLASTHVCECGAPATEWAYDNADPDEIYEIEREPFRVRRYSTDPAHYRPMCHSCHFRFDARTITHCKRGHEFTEENTYQNPTSGWRQCRECQRRMRTLRTQPRRSK